MISKIFLPRSLKWAIHACKLNTKEKIIVTGVNLESGGTLSVFNDALFVFADKFSDKYDIYVFCSKRNRTRYPGLNYLEFSWSKKSYVIRILLEKIFFFQFSKNVKIKLWLSMHDITPRVLADNVVTYVHNPSPFYTLKLQDIYFSPTFALFVLLYKYVYKWGIDRNNCIVVQQSWIKKKFDEIAPEVNKIIAKPKVDFKQVLFSSNFKKKYDRKFFFYPTLPRIFKRIEDFLRVAEFFNRIGCVEFYFIITISGKENNYSRWLFKRFNYLPNVVWLGHVDRGEVFNLYREAHCLIFTSHLETWGLPLTEFSMTNKPIIVPDLPYVYETLSRYPKFAVYDARNIIKLFELTLKIAYNDKIEYCDATGQKSCDVTVDGWSDLITRLIEK